MLIFRSFLSFLGHPNSVSGWAPELIVFVASSDLEAMVIYTRFGYELWIVGKKVVWHNVEIKRKFYLVRFYVKSILEK